MESVFIKKIYNDFSSIHRVKNFCFVSDGPPKFKDLDPNTKEYWHRVRKLGMRRNNLLNKLKRF